MRISDWSSDVCSSDLADVELLTLADQLLHELGIADGVTLQLNTLGDAETREAWRAALVAHFEAHRGDLSEDSLARLDKNPLRILDSKDPRRSEEHTSELQSLMRNSYAVFCLNNKTDHKNPYLNYI